MNTATGNDDDNKTGKKRSERASAPAQRRTRIKVFGTEIDDGMRDAAREAGFETINLSKDTVHLLDEIMQCIVDALVAGAQRESDLTPVARLCTRDLVAYIRKRFLLQADQEHLVKRAVSAAQAVSKSRKPPVDGDNDEAADAMKIDDDDDDDDDGSD